MKVVSDILKNTLKQPTTQRKGKILVNGNYYEVYNVEYYADVYNDGNVIGNAIASQLDFDIPYMAKFDSFKYFDGVWTGRDYEFVDMGTFTVVDEKDEDEFNKHITSFDNLIKFNAPFEDKKDYPKTLFQELQNICSQAGVELVNTSIVNGSFIVENNQFVAGENLKTVLKNICGVSGTYATIKNDKLVLQLQNKTNEVMNKGQHEPIEWKRKTYGINQVVLGLKDVDGEYVVKQDNEDITKNGVHKLVINDNYFAYTQEKRQQLINSLFEQVKGFGYVPYELKGEWLNYMDVGDTITIDGIETIVLRINGKSPKGLESIMSSPAIIDSAIEYVDNTNTLANQQRRTEFLVDKELGVIRGEVSKVETTVEDITTTTQTSIGENNLYLEDALESNALEYHVDGKSEQETRSGKNLYNFEDAITISSGVSTDKDGWITITGDNSSGTSTMYKNYFTNNLNLKSNTNYNIIVEIKSVSGTGLLYPVSVFGSSGQFKNDLYYKFSSLSNGVIKQAIKITRETLESITSGIRTYVAFAAGVSGSITFRISVLEDTTITADAFEYEAFGSSPSPDYPSEIKSIPSIRNLFDYENENNYINFLDASGTQRANIEKISNGIRVSLITDGTYRYGGYTLNDTKEMLGKTYTISCNAMASGSNNGRIIIYWRNNTTATLGSEIKQLPSTGGTFTIPDTIPTNMTNVVILFYGNLTGTGVAGDYVDYTNIMLEKGSIAHPHVPYGAWVKVKVTGKNLFNTPYTENNKLTRTATKDDYYTITDYYAELEVGKTYTFSCKTSGTFGGSNAYQTQVYLMLDKGYTTIWQMLNKDGFTFTPNVSGKYYLRYDVNISGETHSFWDFYIAEEDSFSGYEDYKEKEVLIDFNIYDENGNITGHHELSSIGDTKNTLDIANGQVVLNENIEKIDSYNGETITTNYISTTGELTTGATVYYILAEPKQIILPNVQIPLFEGVNHISLVDDLETTTSIKYYRNTPIAQDYVVQQQLDETNSNLSNTDNKVSQAQSDINDTNTNINNNYYNKEQVDSINSTTTQNITQIRNTMEQNITSTNASISKIQEEITNGVSKVVTTTGTFDENGLNISKSGQQMSSTLDWDGLEVVRDKGKATETEVLTVRSSGVETENLKVRTYFTIGDNTRVENYKGGTGFFYVGGAS